MNRIKQLREEFKISQLELGKKLNKTQLRDCSGITSSTLARLSKNKGVSLEALERICRALDCDIGDVVEFAPGVFAKPIEESLAREIIMEL